MKLPRYIKGTGKMFMKNNVAYIDFIVDYKDPLLWLEFSKTCKLEICINGRSVFPAFVNEIIKDILLLKLYLKWRTGN